MRQIRRGVFETNSSSTHTLTITMKKDYEKWKAGELVWDRYNEILRPYTNEIKEEMEEDRFCGYLTYDQFHDYDYVDQEIFEQSYKTENEEEVVAFGYYGYC